MTIAIAGESTAMMTGTAIASARMRRACWRAIVTLADDSSATGNSVMLPIDHSDTTSSLAATAAAIGSTSGRTKARSTSRRSGSRGHAVSATALQTGREVGRAATTAMSVGIAR